MSLQKATSCFGTNILKESVQTSNFGITHEPEGKTFTKSANKPQENSKSSFYLASNVFKNNKKGSAYSENNREVPLFHRNRKNVSKSIRKKEISVKQILRPYDAVDNQGRTKLHCLAMLGRKEELEQLLKDGVHPNVTDNLGKTPLHLAVEYDHISTVELLLEKGAGVNARTKDGRTPLSFAFFNNETLSESWKIILVYGGVI